MYIKSYKICKHCAKDIISSRYKVHENKCLLQQELLLLPKGKSGAKKGSTPWNKNLTKHTSEIIKVQAEQQSIKMLEMVKNGTYIPIKNNDEWKERLSIRQSLTNSGGRCKWFNYKDVYLQGTWELNIAKKLDEMNLNWEKVTKPWVYYDNNGKNRKYTPDLYLPQFDLYLEIKGYWWGGDKLKMQLVMSQHNDKKIFILEKENYKKLLDGELVWSFERLPEEQ